MTPLRQAAEDLHVRAIAVVAVVGTAIGVAAVLVALWLAPDELRTEARRAFDPRAVIAGVEQQDFEAPARAARMQARARDRLERYAGSDAGLARIPIERAIELVLNGRRPPEAGASSFATAEVP